MPLSPPSHFSNKHIRKCSKFQLFFHIHDPFPWLLVPPLLYKSSNKPGYEAVIRFFEISYFIFFSRRNPKIFNRIFSIFLLFFCAIFCYSWVVKKGKFRPNFTFLRKVRETFTASNTNTLVLQPFLFFTKRVKKR